MNIKNVLCEQIDTKKTGKVTALGIILFVISLIAMLMFALVVIITISIMLGLVITSGTGYKDDPLITSVVGFSIIISVVLIFVVGSAICNYLNSIIIIQCPLRDDKKL